MADKYCYWCGEAYSAYNVNNYHAGSLTNQWACSFCARDDEIYLNSTGSITSLWQRNDLKPIITGCQSFGKMAPRLYLISKGYIADFTDPAVPSFSIMHKVLAGNKSTILPPNWNGKLPLPGAYAVLPIPPANVQPLPIPIASTTGNGFHCVGCNNELTGGLSLICSSCYKDRLIYDRYIKFGGRKGFTPNKKLWGAPLGFNPSTYGIKGPPWTGNNIPPNPAIQGMSNYVNSMPPAIPAQAPQHYDSNAALKDYFILTGLLPRKTGPVPDNKIRPLCTDCGMPLSETLDAYYGKDPKQAAKCNNCRG